MSTPTPILATHTIDLVMADLLRRYLEDTATGAADAAVPKHLMSFLEDPQLPSIVITAKEETSKNTSSVTLSLSIILCVSLKSEATGAAQVDQWTTQNQASVILQAVNTRLRDTGAFQTWLGTQDSDNLAGWTLLKIVHEGLAAPTLGGEARTLMQAVTMKLHLLVSRVTA
jgi:hypothetical protein